MKRSMEHRKFTQDEMEKIMESFNGIQPAEAPPFFYTRLQAKLTKSMYAPRLFVTLLTKPALSLVTLSVLLVVNILVIGSYIKTSGKKTVATTSGIEKFAKE